MLFNQSERGLFLFTLFRHGRIISKKFYNSEYIQIYSKTIYKKTKKIEEKHKKKTLIYMIAVCESVEANQLFKPLLKTLRDCADRS